MTEGGGNQVGKNAGLTLSTVTQLLGGLAAVAGLIYVTGGAVLALRLAFVDLPALGVVGQLPHGFLFSIAASQVLIPALAIGAVHVIYVAYRDTPPAARPSVWATARLKKLSRRRHLLVASVVPVLLVLPGALLALGREPGTRWLAAGTAVVAAVGAVVVVRRYRQSAKGIKEREPVDDPLLQAEPTIAGIPRYYLWILWGGAGFLVTSVLATALSGWQVKFLWLFVAWAACVPAVLGYLLLRGLIGDRYRADYEKRHLIRAQVVLSLAVSALMVPGLVVFWAAWPLENATVCTTTAKANGDTFTVDGALVGETGDRVYIGNTETNKDNPSIVSIPQDNVARTVIGGESTATASCATEPPDAPAEP